MLKALKKLFVYEEPSIVDIENGVEFLEDLSESLSWNERQGSKDRQQKDNRDQEKTVKQEEGGKKKNKKQSDTASEGTVPKTPKILKPEPIEKLTDHKNKRRKENDEKGDRRAEQNKSDGGGYKTQKNDDEKNISKSLSDNINYLKKKFHVPTNQDAIIREFNIAHKLPACVVFIDGMVEESIIIQFTLPQLMDVNPFCGFEGGCPLDFIERNVLSVHQIERMNNFKEIIEKILSGLTAIFIDGCDECIIMESRGFERRSVGAPVTETVVHGSQEGFTENLRTNITLIRRIIKSEDLITEFKTVSKKNNTLTALLYMEGITNPRIIKEVKRRIENLNVDYIMGSGMLEQLIEDKSFMFFPQVISTERPDRVASFLMDGKAVLICEGTPFALAMPITFFDLYHTSEESNIRWQYGSFMRLVRFIGILLAALLPGMYTGLILFHQEMIPTSLLSSIISSRVAVPFPTIVELLLMEISFELIREGGIRVPGVTGNTLGIIGALILGQAAVQAGLVSPILIIIVAVSGLGSFAIPNYSLSLGVRIIRFFLIFFGCLAGFYGISAGVTIIFAMTLSMKSFGVPFFTPLAPSTYHDKDLIIRGPLYDQKKRPDFLNTGNEIQMDDEPRGWKTEDKQEER